VSGWKPAEGVNQDKSAHPIGDRKVARRSAANETSLHPIHLMRFRRHCLERTSLALLQVPNDLGKKLRQGALDTAMKIPYEWLVEQKAKMKGFP